MRRKNSLLFVKVFMLSILVASPFLVKQALPKKEKLDEIIYEDGLHYIDKEDSNTNKNTNSNITTDSNSNVIFNSNTNINSNTNSNTNSNKPTNSNSNSNSNSEVKNPVYQQKGTFVPVDDSYFKDALFIGDSRTVGIKEYGKLKEATYFCDTGMSIYNIYSRKVSISGVGKVDLKKLLSTKKYGKIYIMLGINEIGYPLDNSAKKFREVVQYIQKSQPNAIIIIQANLHVSKAKSDNNSTFNNKRIDKYNSKLAAIADSKRIFYIDANGIFDDGKGNLKAETTFDNVHIYAKYYIEWTKYIKEHGIKIETDEGKKEEPKEEENPDKTSEENNSNKEDSKDEEDRQNA